MKKTFTKLIAALALLAVFAMPMKAWATDITVKMTGYAGSTSNSYVNSNMNSTIDGVGFTACGYIPNNGQVRGKNTKIEASSNGNFHIYNTTEMPGAITQIVMSISNASSTNCFQNKMYAATGTSSQASVSSIEGLSAGMLSSDNSSFTWTFDENDGITYFKLCSTEKFTKGSVNGCSIEITYATSGGGITQLTTPANFQTTSVGDHQASFSWDAVSNARSYTISYTPTGGTEQTATGLNGTSHTITGLTNSTAYTCKIKAIGDGTNYSDSEYSDEISVTPTAAQQYTVTIADGITGGTVGANTTTATAGTEISLSKEPAAGYGFTSWNVYKTGDQNTTVTVTNDKFNMPTYDVTVSATFTAYVVTLHAGNGTVAGAQTAAWNVSMNNGNLPTATPPCNAWTFYGWSTSAVGSQTTTAPTCVNGTGYTPEGNITLYAVYSKTEGSGSAFNGTTSTGSFLIYAAVNANNSTTNYYATGTGSKISSITNSSQATTYTFEQPTGYDSGEFAIKTGNDYITYNSSTNLGTSSNPYKWTISEGAKGTWRLTSETSSRGFIFRAGSYNVFGGYSTGNVNANGTEYYDLEIGTPSTTYYHSTPDCTEYLSAPVVTLEAGNNSITPSWEAVANASTYTLQYSTTNDFASYEQNTNATSGTAIAGLSNGTTYYVRVKAVPAVNSNYAESDWSTVVSATPTGIVVATPEFSVTGIGTGTTGEYVEAAEVTITTPDYNSHYIYYTTDGSDPDDSSEAYDGTPIDVLTTTTIKAIAYDGDLNESEIGSIEVTIVETTPIADVCAAEVGEDYYITEGIVTYKRNTSNMFIEDDDAGILVYGTNNNYAIGDRIVVKGQRAAYQGKPELSGITILGKFSSNNTLPMASVTVAQAASDEYLYRRVQLTQVQVGETESDLTPLSQGNNSISVYQIPSIENVTEEGYYLKTVTGIVAYYGSDYQMYVSSDGIVPYTVTASSNSTALGTVATSGYVVTATPASGIGYASPAYVAVTDATEYDIQQEDNTFTIVTNGDMEIEIQFASAATYTISYTTNSIPETATTQVLQSSGEITELIEPTAANIPNGYTFMGWTTSAISDTQNNAPDFVEVGDDIDDDMALIAVFAIDKITSTTYDKVAANTSNIVNGTYLIAVNKVNSNNYNFADGSISSERAGVEGTGVATASTYSPSGIPSGAKEYTLSGDNTNGFLIHCSAGYLHAASAGSLSYNNANNAANNSEKWTFSVKGQGFVLTGASGGTKTSCNSSTASTAIRNYASNGAYYDPLFFFKKNETHEYSNYCTTVSQAPISFETAEYTIPTGTAYTLTTPVTVPSGKTLIVPANAVFANADPANLIIEDGGRLIVYNEGVKATVKKNVTKSTNWGTGSSYTPDGWYFIASPVNGADFPAGTYDDQDIFQLDWASTQWLNLQNSDNSTLFNAGFQRGTGYLYASKEDLQGNNSLSFAGEIQPLNNVHKATVALAVDGWNLIGNPLTCKVTVDCAFSELVNASAVTNKEANSVINPCQGIAVYGNKDDVVTFTKAESQAATAPSNNNSLQMTLAKKVTSRGEVSTKVVDNAVVSFNNSKGMPKFNMLSGSAKLYIPQNDEEYSVMFSDKQGDLPLNFKANETGTYTISFETNDRASLQGIYLIDILAEEEIDLSVNPSYTFIGSPADRSARFKIVFRPSTSSGTDIFAYQNGNDIVVTGEGELQIFDVMGRVVMHKHVNGIETINVKSQGVYIFRLNEKSQKIVVR